MKQPGYCMFCVTPSERSAIGLTDDQKSVHLLERTNAEYQVRREVTVQERSHTEIILRLGPHAEPTSFDAFAQLALGN